MERICCIFNIGSHYREPIYRAITENFNCHFYFGDKVDGDIKKINYETFPKFKKELKRINLIGNFYWLKNSVQLAFEPYKTYIITGEIYCVSSWFLALFCRMKGKHVITWTHGWYGKEGIVKKIIKKLYFKMSNNILLYGNYAKQLMIKEGFNEKKLHVIHNSLDYDKQLVIRNSMHATEIYKEHFGNENNTLIFIGRLTEVKRIDLLLEAIASLKEQGKEYNLVLVGDGVMRKDLEEITTKLNIAKQVWFYGACYDENKNAELIYNADLCVSPGNVGLTAMHTMMFGTAVATHDTFCRQMPEFEAIKEGKTGTFFKINDAASIADSISSWFKKHSGNREEVRQECYKEIDTQWNPYFQMKIFKEVIKK